MPKKNKPKKEHQGSSSSQGHAQGSAGNGEHSDAGNSWMKSPKQGGIPGIKSKNGCFPKALMLLMPFIVFGAYLFLRP
jgi:hypothetical protein